MSRSRDLANLAGDATGLETLTVSDITDLTASVAELNKMDGVTASTAELNKLTGVTADTNELNLLDGVTATTTELNYVDGVSSALQTQIDGKASLSGATFTGNITIPTPTASGHAVTKDYVDNTPGTTGEIELTDAVTLSAQTITYQKIYLGNTFTVGGNLTVNGDLVLGKIIADSTGQTLSGAGYSITGTGTLTIGATLT